MFILTIEFEYFICGGGDGGGGTSTLLLNFTDESPKVFLLDVFNNQ